MNQIKKLKKIQKNHHKNNYVHVFSLSNLHIISLSNHHMIMASAQKFAKCQLQKNLKPPVLDNVDYKLVPYFIYIVYHDIIA